MIALPAYLDAEAWSALLEMRKAKKVPTTVYAAKLLLYELQRIKDAGHDPNAALRQSILKGYTDVYAPKEKVIEATPESRATKAQNATQALFADMEQAREAALKSKPPEAILKLVGKR
jgi:hypothetical protein